MKHFLNRLGIRILSYFFIVIAFLSSVGCLNLNLGTDRSPSSKAKALAEKTSDLYIKYKLIKNLNLETISTKDCKAFAQQNSILCETVECKAILDDQELNCKDNLCKALINKESPILKNIKQLTLLLVISSSHFDRAFFSFSAAIAFTSSHEGLGRLM